MGYLRDFKSPINGVIDITLFFLIKFNWTKNGTLFLHMGLAMGLLNTNLWDFSFDYIFPYPILLDQLSNLYISIWG